YELPPSKGLPGESGVSYRLRARAYGSTSRWRGAGMFWTPTRSAKRDAIPLSVFGTKGNSASSFLRSIQRSTRTPHTWTGAWEHRNCENGISISTVQPSESTEVATRHTGSQDGSS